MTRTLKHSAAESTNASSDNVMLRLNCASLILLTRKLPILCRYFQKSAEKVSLLSACVRTTSSGPTWSFRNSTNLCALCKKNTCVKWRSALCWSRCKTPATMIASYNWKCQFVWPKALHLTLALCAVLNINSRSTKMKSCTCTGVPTRTWKQWREFSLKSVSSTSNIGTLIQTKPCYDCQTNWMKWRPNKRAITKRPRSILCIDGGSSWLERSLTN